MKPSISSVGYHAKIFSILSNIWFLFFSICWISFVFFFILKRVEIFHGCFIIFLQFYLSIGMCRTVRATLGVAHLQLVAHLVSPLWAPSSSKKYSETSYLRVCSTPLNWCWPAAGNLHWTKKHSNSNFVANLFLFLRWILVREELAWCWI